MAVTGGAGAPRSGRAARGWLWGALALAAGVFLGPAGWWVVAACALLIGAALVGLSAHKSLAVTALWVGLGASAGVALYLVTEVVDPGLVG